MTDILERHNTIQTLSAFAGSLLIVMVLALSACSELSESQSQRVEEALNDTLLSSTETWDVDMKLMEEGQKKVRIRGSYAATYSLEEMNETRIQGPVNVQVFDSTGAVETRATANRAIYRAENTLFELYGDVNVVTVTGNHLRTEFLKWDQGTNRISTPQFVIITTPSDSIAGTGFEGTTDLDASNYTIKEPTGRVIVD